jgi:two-component system chemotaxis response regulator CheB
MHAEMADVDGPRDEPLHLGCPDCGGVMTALPPDAALRFRCRVGHEFDGEALLAAQEVELEDALWAAIRGLEEQAVLAARLTGVSIDRTGQDRHRLLAEDARRQAEVIRAFLLGRPSLSPSEDADRRAQAFVEPSGSASRGG